MANLRAMDMAEEKEVTNMVHQVVVMEEDTSTDLQVVADQEATDMVEDTVNINMVLQEEVDHLTEDMDQAEVASN